MQNPYTDKEIEQKWEEFEDVLMNEDSDGELIIANDWHEFSKGTNREDIWNWFDEHHSKGVAWLLYEYKRK